jgi:hypothetical protein
MNSFWKGVITGVAGMLVLVLVVLVFRSFHERDRKIYEYMEAQHEIETLQEDIGNRPLNEFLEDPAIREAQRLQGENSRLKQSRVKTAIITGVVCFFGGLAVGIGGGIAIIQGVR